MNDLLPVTPTAVFSELFPANTVFAPRTVSYLIRWAVDSSRLDTITGVTLTIMGDMPLICHQNAATELILDFFRKSGLKPATSLSTYDTEEEAIALARKYLNHSKKLVCVYPPPPALETSEGLLVQVSLYNWLNDKANMTRLVDKDYMPRNQIVPTDSLSQLHDFLPGLPVFIKACHPGASGGGNEVYYCTEIAHRTVAIKSLEPRLDGLSGIRIEEAMETCSCWCLNLAILESSVRYLGAATQLFSEPAKQSGSRIDPDDLPSDSVVAIALDIAERARSIGYRGIAGFDIGITSAGQPFVFDLNFRMVSSTPQVLLHEAAVRRVHARISQSWNKMVKGTLAPALNLISEFSRSGKFVPTRLYEATAVTGGRSVITGIIVASTLNEIESIIVNIETTLKDLLAG